MIIAEPEKGMFMCRFGIKNLQILLILLTYILYPIKILRKFQSFKIFHGILRTFVSDTMAQSLVTVREYLPKLLDQAAFLITCFAKVNETGQIFIQSDDFRLRMPDIKLNVVKYETLSNNSNTFFNTIRVF